MKTNLVYMAKPTYGGWVTFTAHLCLKYDCNLFKIGKRSESKKREYGYGVEYQNLRIDDLLSKKKIVITAIDKHYWKYLHLFPKGTTIIIHDPTELKVSKKEENPLLNMVKNNHFKIITIRKTVQDYIKVNFNIDSEFLPHPFYEYPKTKERSDYYSLSISRIDFDKHTDLILKANKLIADDSKKIQIFGAENRLYVHHKLKDLNFEEFWKGKYPKTLPLKDNDKDLLNNCKFVTDMSIIKNDGGGTQYTFLEAVYHGCALILHKEWVEKGTTFKKDHNCYVVGFTDDVGQEIANIINGELDARYKRIIRNSKELLKDHINVQWF
jgi:hypothetical protein